MGALLLLFIGSLSWAATCPTSLGATEGETPKVEQDLGENGQLLVCGFQAENKESPAQNHLSEFEVFYNFGLNEPVRLFGASALETFEVIKWSKGLLFQQIENFNKQEVKTFETTITCSLGKCTVSKDKCIFKKLRDIKPAGFRDLKRHINGSKKEMTPSKETIHSAAAFALSGDREAIQLFLQLQPKLKLDGEVSEIYRHYHRIIVKLHSLKCL